MILKKLAIVLSVLLAVSFSGSPVKTQSEIIIKPSSKLTIHGITNVANFACKFNTVTLKDEIAISYTAKSCHTSFENALLVLDNKEFDCGRKIINKDFNDLLKSDTYPQIAIRLKEVVRSKTDPKIVTAHVDFIIAGVTKSYQIPIHISRDQALTVNGKIKLNIRDFGLENPKKMLGLIKIEDVVTVHFHLDMDII
ncbi:YceI family protein [Formosa sp. 4Alg 33]|uniref:YceI family protein n=1 Tax=Formosa sp. 4Alg 33 TaxID=3382189 RepID=UPI003D9C1E84